MVNKKIQTNVTCHNKHLDFLVQHTAFSFYGDAEFTVYFTHNTSDAPLLDWVRAVQKDSGGWIKSTDLSRANRTDRNADTLSKLLSRCGYDFGKMKSDCDQDEVVSYLRKIGLALRKTKGELDAKIAELEEKMNQGIESASDIEEYIAVQEDLLSVQDQISESFERLWFPLDDDIFAAFEEHLTIRSDGNFYMYACRSRSYMYLLCFATS
jgi:hypothetical protein